MIKDPNILVSYINTMLRDKYDSLEKLCDIEDESEEKIVEILKGAGYTYNPKTNQFS